VAQCCGRSTWPLGRKVRAYPTSQVYGHWESWAGLLLCCPFAGIGGGIGGYVLSRINRYVVRRHDSASIQSPGGTPVKARPNPSIEQASSGRLRLSTAAALVER
jgi:hypothetical protein